MSLLPDACTPAQNGRGRDERWSSLIQTLRQGCYINQSRANRTLGAAYLKIGLASTKKARSLIEAQGGLPLRTRRQQNFVAVGLPGRIERIGKNPSAEPQSSVVGVSDDILDHSIGSSASGQVRHDRERARGYKPFRCLRHDDGREARCKQRRPDAFGVSFLQRRIVRMKVSIEVQHLGQIMLGCRANNGVGHVQIPLTMAWRGHYQRPSTPSRLSSLCRLPFRL